MFRGVIISTRKYLAEGYYDLIYELKILKKKIMKLCGFIGIRVR